MSVPAVADHFDVIEFKLKDGCSLASYLQVVKDFNEWGKEHGYWAEIASKVQHSDLTTLLWIGRSTNAAAFGRAWGNRHSWQSTGSHWPAATELYREFEYFRYANGLLNGATWPAYRHVLLNSNQAPASRWSAIPPLLNRPHLLVQLLALDPLPHGVSSSAALVHEYMPSA
jgi:hypothetical protein